MQIVKWCNSLVVQLPNSMVKLINLKVGNEVDLRVDVQKCGFNDSRQADLKELLTRLRALRDRLPADYRFDRLEANAREALIEQSS